MFLKIFSSSIHHFLDNPTPTVVNRRYLFCSISFLSFFFPRGKLSLLPISIGDTIIPRRKKKRVLGGGAIDWKSLPLNRLARW